MFTLYRRGLQLLNVGNSTTHLDFLPHSTSLIVETFSSVEVVKYDKKNQEKPPSFTVSYLINSCGLSPENARHLSKRLHFKCAQNPDSVIVFLRKHEFTSVHLSKLVGKHPHVLMANIEKTLSPKFEFFHSVGISGAELAGIMCSNTAVLRQSLNKQIIPCYNLLKSLFSDKAKIVNVLKNAMYLFDAHKKLAPNIAALKGVGVKQAAILSLLTWKPNCLCENSETFKEVIKKVIDMGFNPSTTTFVVALLSVASTTEETRGQKMEAFMNWGWSEDEFLYAFRKHPKLVTMSLDVINDKMDFIVNKMGWKPSAVARAPIVLAFSLEKRIIPRCSVIYVLQSKGLVKGILSLASFIIDSENRFMDMFISKYEEKVPEILDIYQGKVHLLELGYGFQESSTSK